jgi:5-methylcytosine-specific restriction endonuclease McrA
MGRRTPAQRAARREEYAVNAAKERERSRRRYATDPEARKRKVKQWQDENPNLVKEYYHKYQAKQLGLLIEISPGVVDRLYATQNGMCAYAGLLCNADLLIEKFHIDHIVPRASRGSHTEANLQLLCVKCSQTKAAKHPDEFLRDALKFLQPISPE